jgi:predicted nucleotidyltransferase
MKNMVFAKPLKDPVQAAILKTLIYSDIFEFPLTRDELWEFLITERKIPSSSFDKTLENLKKNKITNLEGYYCLKGSEKFVKTRIQNIPQIKYKLNIARKAAYFLSFIPTVLFIGISGGLAMGDVQKEDDIDLFIISKNNSIFKTRFLILIILEILGLRRTRSEKKARDKICVNYIIDETKISFSSDRHDLYTAHEIVQLKPLYERVDMYSKFIKANNWINKLIPNLNAQQKKDLNMIKKSKFTAIFNINIIYLLPEQLLRRLQIEIMKKHKTTEIVSRYVLAFNPKDYRLQTLRKMRLRLLNLGLLTKV